jgi:hypothetical protein
MAKKRFEKELKKLLDYCEDDEQSHYEECDETQRKSHIYLTIRYLRKYLEVSHG